MQSLHPRRAQGSGERIQHLIRRTIVIRTDPPPPSTGPACG